MKQVMKSFASCVYVGGDPLMAYYRISFSFYEIHHILSYMAWAQDKSLQWEK